QAQGNDRTPSERNAPGKNTAAPRRVDKDDVLRNAQRIHKTFVRRFPLARLAAQLLDLGVELFDLGFLRVEFLQIALVSVGVWGDDLQVGAQAILLGGDFIQFTRPLRQPALAGALRILHGDNLGEALLHAGANHRAAEVHTDLLVAGRA